MSRIHSQDRSRHSGAMARFESLEARRLLALVTWDGGGNGTDWSDANNWSTNAVPGAADDVIITVPASLPAIHVRNGTTASIRSLQSAEPIIVGANSRLQVATASRSTSLTWLRDGGELRITGGTYRVEGASAQFVVDSGTLGGSGILLIESAASADVAGQLVVSGAVIQNQGTLRWSDGDLSMAGGTIFNGGTINVVHPSSGTFSGRVRGGAGTNALFNLGTINVASGVVCGTARDGADVEFENNGTVNLNGGTFIIGTGGDHAGRFNVNAGGTLHVAVAHIFEGASIVTGAGRLELSGDGAIGLNGTVSVGTLATSAEHVMLGGVTSPRLEVHGGRATLPGNMTFSTGLITAGTLDGADATFTAALDWEGGSMVGPGITRIPFGSQCRIGGATDATRTLSRVLELEGTTTWSTGSIDLVNGTINVRQSFAMQPSSGPLVIDNTSGAAMFNNLHFMQKNIADHGVTFNVPVHSPTGNIFLNAGAMNLARGGAFQNFGATPGSTLSIGGDALLLSDTTLLGVNGHLRFTGGQTTFDGNVSNAQSLTVSGGTYTTSGAICPQVHVTGGTLILNRHTTITGGSMTAGEWLGSGNVTIGGSLTWSGGTFGGTGRLSSTSTGAISVNGGFHTLRRDALLDGFTHWTSGDIELAGGSIINQGVFVARNESGTMSLFRTSGDEPFINKAFATLARQLGGTARFHLRVHNEGQVTVEGGTLRLGDGGEHTGNFYIGAGAAVELGGAHDFEASSLIPGQGQLVIANADVDIAGDQNFGGDVIVGNNGRIDFAGQRTQLASLQINFGGSAVVRAGGSSRLIVEDLGIAHGSSLDLNDNVMIVDHGDQSLIGYVHSLLRDGYAGGAWNGSGIRSSVAAAQPGTAIGCAESVDLFSSFPATFAGEAIDDTAVVLRFALRGDANLDGRVNLADFNRLAANFGSTSSAWSRGDFNYDGNVNLSDFNALASNFGRELGVN
jgi:hypothetical protein